MLCAKRIVLLTIDAFMYVYIHQFFYVKFHFTDPPTMRPFWQQNIIEGRNLTVTCDFIPGNPNPTILFWTKESNPLFRQKGATLLLPKIQRSSSGEYKCIAENIYSNGEKGTYNQSMILNVLCKCFVSNIIFF